MPVVVKAPCSIAKIIKHTDEIATIELKPLKRLSRYRPGHFLHFSMDEYDPSKAWPESRVFSIANYDPTLSLIRITYSIKGSYTRRMYNDLRIGDRIWIKLPYGEFIFRPENKRLILIAGGTGITPFISFLESLNVNNSLERIILYYGAYDRTRLIFEEQIDRIAEKNEILSVNKYLESTEEEQGFITGKLQIERIYSETIEIASPHYYISGPKDMIISFRDYLYGKNIDKDRVHIDNWE